MTVGMDHACALRIQEPSPPPRPPLALSSEPHVGVCWGSNFVNPDLVYAPDDPDQTGLSYSGKAIARAGEVLNMAAGAEHTCSVTASGHLQCWGNFNNNNEIGAPTGNHWQLVKAGNMRFCALSMVGNAVVACWGLSGRMHLDTVNSHAFDLCPSLLRAPNQHSTRGSRARVRHYGPDLSSLEHLDGSWLQVLPVDLDIERDPFITILAPHVSYLSWSCSLGNVTTSQTVCSCCFACKCS